VADHIQSKHTIVELTPQDFLDAIPETVRICESYDTTTVRASVGNYLVAKYIHEHTANKVVLNGDYSDEVTGGYLYLRNCSDPAEFAEDCKRLVKEIYLFDSLRSDRTISSQGLEPRTPFSDKAFVDYYQSLPAEWRMSHGRLEKLLLREAFDDGKLLPRSILFRKKEAFSDAVSTPEMSWHTIVKRHVDDIVTDAQFERRADEFPFNTPQLKETMYYRRLFRSHYVSDHVIPHYWLPRFSGNLVDPSAREL
jgi:asparagine synthase (glutamine-hydrolysing)